MGQYDWLDFDLLEHRVYAKSKLDDFRNEIDKYRKLQSMYDKQKAYVRELEMQVDVLQKTLDLVNKNKPKRRVKCWRSGECLRKR